MKAVVEKKEYAIIVFLRSSFVCLSTVLITNKCTQQHFFFRSFVVKQLHCIKKYKIDIPE